MASIDFDSKDFKLAPEKKEHKSSWNHQSKTRLMVAHANQFARDPSKPFPTPKLEEKKLPKQSEAKKNIRDYASEMFYAMIDLVNSNNITYEINGKKMPIINNSLKTNFINFVIQNSTNGHSS